MTTALSYVGNLRLPARELELQRDQAAIVKFIGHSNVHVESAQQ